ncbi:hypothetical protein QA802_33960 [Streptomyces sp. B21-105]|uniref:hypothetical protein n=1 Tax=Streptomyces sp. B21-105 TaxID=3039417 RepID=UPI002FF02C72
MAAEDDELGRVRVLAARRAVVLRAVHAVQLGDLARRAGGRVQLQHALRAEPVPQPSYAGPQFGRGRPGIAPHQRLLRGHGRHTAGRR